MSRFDECLNFVLKWEGNRFTDDKADRGGATRYGIIQKVYDRWRKSHGMTARSVAEIEMDEVKTIYRDDYWRATACDTMPEPIDLFMFDSAVQHGPRQAALFLQRALGVDADGVIGRQTMAAIREEIMTGQIEPLVAHMFDQRDAFYDAIVKKDVTQQKWRKGWANRMIDLELETERSFA